jgi:hypothetical protein
VVCNLDVSRICNVKTNFIKNNLSLHIRCLCLTLGGLHNLCIFLETFLVQIVDGVILQGELWKCLSHGKYECSFDTFLKGKEDRPYWELIGNKRQHTVFFRSFLYLMLLFAGGMCS